MALQEKLDQVKQEFSANESVAPETKKALREFSQHLSQRNLEERAVRQGRQIPDFILPEASGDSIRSGKILARGPAVIVFFRGKW